MGNKVSPQREDVTEAVAIDDAYYLQSKDGSRIIWCKQWKPNNIEKARCAVYICHGLGEYCMVYDSFARWLAQKYDALVFANDHMSHGRNSGYPRAYAPSLDVFVDDMALHINHVYSALAKNQGSLPLFVFAHSMGGTISLLYSLRRHGAAYSYPGGLRGGLMLMGPLIDFSRLTLSHQLMYQIVHRIGRILPRSLPVACIPYEDCVSQPEVAAQFHADPFRFHGYLRTGIVSAMVDAVEEIKEKADSFETPLFVGHGTEDKLCCPKASQEFTKRAISKVKTCKMYERGAHCLLHELKNGVRDALMVDLAEWMDGRLKHLEAMLS